MKYNNSMIENKFEYNATLICFFFLSNTNLFIHIRESLSYKSLHFYKVS